MAWRLHSGVFTRAQFCDYFEAHRSENRRFAELCRTLLDRREAIESDHVTFNGGGKNVQDFREGNLPGAWS